MRFLRLLIRNESSVKRACTRPGLTQLASSVCLGEGAPECTELSLLLCGDPRIAELNKMYRHKNQATDVLSFAQEIPPGHPITEESPYALGDIVISLDTVERRCQGDLKTMRAEVRLLFCHGLLHLLGVHHGTAEERRNMIKKQAQYLGVTEPLAWHK